MISGLFASHELTHQIDQWLLEEAGEPEGGRGVARRPLQLLPDSRDARHDAGDGGWRDAGLLDVG